MQISKVGRTTLCIALAAAMTACGAAERLFSTDCVQSDDPRLVAQAGAIPVFDWKPECRVRDLSVVRKDGPVVTWAIEGNIVPPVTYGTVPSGAKQSVAPGSLEKGKQYFVMISYEGRTTGLAKTVDFDY